MNKIKYGDFLAKNRAIPLFSKDWWLDAVCGSENWNVALVEKGDVIVGSMPYFCKNLFGFKLLTNPPLTQSLGPWICSFGAKNSKTLGDQKNIMQSLLEQLPSHDYFSQNWHYTNTNWLPFYWRGYKQSTRYTYILPQLSDEKLLWSGMTESARTDIRKAENRFKLVIRDDLCLDDFMRLNTMTFRRQGLKLPYTLELIQKLDSVCVARQCRKIWIAEDAEGRHHAGIYVVWDENSAYYLMGGSDPELRNSGATSLCLWTAIRHAASVTNSFDFEGSMMEPVERFVRSFGAMQVPYFNLTKTPSRLLRVREALQHVIRG